MQYRQGRDMKQEPHPLHLPRKLQHEQNIKFEEVTVYERAWREGGCVYRPHPLYVFQRHQ